ncbi:MAG: chorismate-binding protein [Thermoplasmata archaeon]
MTEGPWEEFVAEASRRPVCGYFERGDAPGLGRRWAGWFTTADEVLRLSRPAPPRRLDQWTGRWLSAHPDGAVVGYVGFDAYSLWEPLVAGRRGPFPLGEVAAVPTFHQARIAGGHRRPVGPPGGDGGPEGQVPSADETLPGPRLRRAVGRLRRAIAAGEAFQVVVSSRRRFVVPEDLLARAGALRARERFAYFYCLKFADRTIVGASPESVIEIEGDRAAIHPIAGTRPIGPAGARRRLLERDPKELAEHRMLVDLARNDLGRIARPGTVRVRWRERTVRFARLDHLISRVDARLRPEVGPWSALAAAFPAGTVSGAPKIRATALLRREERTWRGPYGGAVGCLRPGGRAAWALAIRTAFARGRSLYTAAGAGIVWGSRPAREETEIRTKRERLERTLVGRPPCASS